MRILSIAILFFGCLAPAYVQSADAPRTAGIPRPALDAKDVEALLRTDWYGIYFKDKKIGYFRITRERSGEFIKELQTSSMKIASFGQKSEFFINQVAIFDGRAPYRLVRAEKIQENYPTPPEKTILIRTDQGLTYTYQTGREVSTKQIPDLDYNLADALASDLWIRRQPRKGDSAQFKQLEVKDAKIYSVSSKIVAIKSSLVAGVNIRYFEVESESSKDRISIPTRHDDQGRMLSGVIAVFELRLETEEQAKNTEYSQDLFVLGQAKTDRPLGATARVTDLILQFDGKEGDFFEGAPRQSIAPGPQGSRLLKIGKKYGKEMRASKEEIEECLQETSAYCITHPRVKALAAEAVGAAQTPEDKVRNIVGFVHGFVRPARRAALPNMHDLMDKKAGDCKSYALMVTNLARAAGIPAREVFGLLYMGDDQKAFGGHAWNEVVLNGVWVPVDATLNEAEIDAAHLCCGTEQKALKNLLISFGKLSFKVVEVNGR